MRSSTSSSESTAERVVPERPWLAVLLVSALGAALAAFGLEAFWRARGHRPSVTDDLDLWALERERADDAGLATVALVGFSRMQLGFDPATFRARHPELDLVNLTAQARLPLAVLRDLSEDEQFRGTVLVDVVELAFLPDSIEEQQDNVRHHRRVFGPARAWERTLATPLQARLVIQNPNIGLLRVLQNGRVPPPLYVTTRADRSRAADYTGVDAERQARERLEGGRRRHESEARPSPAEWLAQTEIVEAWADRIRTRGGRVAFIRFPVSPERLALDETYYPRALHWDAWAARSRSVVVRSEDVPSLAGYRCPDGSHLDYRDAPAYTQALLEELERRGVLSTR